MVKRIALLILVLLPVLACGGLPTPGYVSPTLVAPPRGDTWGETPTPAFVYPTPATPPVLIEAVVLKGGEAVRVICYGGLVMGDVYSNEVIIYCLEGY